MRANRWEDHYTRRAKKEKWLARSVYKLKEIDDRFGLIRKGAHVLDIGCFPGSWSQYSLRKVGKKGKVTGIDINAPRQGFPSNFSFIKANVLMLDVGSLLERVGPVDVVISDLAPKTTGIRLTDAARSMELAQRAVDISFALLKGEGRFLCKIFEGSDLREIKDRVLLRFKAVRLIRPKATRKGSREIYLVASGFREEEV